MKKILPFLLVLLCLACSKQDDEETIPDAYIYGTITDYNTGNLISNATVELYEWGMTSYLIKTVITGSNGVYSFPDIKFKYKYDESYMIIVTHPNYKNEYHKLVNLSPGDKLDINISLK